MEEFSFCLKFKLIFFINGDKISQSEKWLEANVSFKPQYFCFIE